MAAAFEFESVMVRTEARPAPSGFGLNDLAMVGCARTSSVPDTARVVPASVVVIAPVLFRSEPASALVTFTVTVQEPLAGTMAPESARLVPLLAAVTVGAPPHVVAPLADAVFTRFAG